MKGRKQSTPPDTFRSDARDAKHHARPAARALASRGRRVILVEYRRVPGSPCASVADLQLLARHLREMGETVVGWVGHSAGGTLALLHGLTPVHPPTRVIALAAVTDFHAARAAGLGDGAVDVWLGETNPDEFDPTTVRGGLGQQHDPCGILLIHGSADATVPIEQSKSSLGDALIVADAHHFDLIDPGSGAWDVVVDAISARFGPH